MAIAKREKAWTTKIQPGQAVSDRRRARSSSRNSPPRSSTRPSTVAVNLGIDAAKSDQQVRGSTVMPHGTGKTLRVAVFTAGKNAELREGRRRRHRRHGRPRRAGEGRRDQFRRVIASPDAMRVVGQLGQILGPRGLMPNPKVGTVTPDVATAVKNAKAGQVHLPRGQGRHHPLHRSARRSSRQRS